MDRHAAADMAKKLSALPPIERYEIIGTVIAVRGANFGVDLPFCAKRQVKLHPLADVLESPAVSKGQFVLLRGKVVEVSRKRSGVVIEVDETIRQARDEWQTYSEYKGDFSEAIKGVDQYGRGYVHAGTHRYSIETGRTLTARLMKPSTHVGLDREYVFLARFDRKRPPRDALDDSEHGYVDVLAVFEPGTSLPEVAK